MSVSISPQPHTPFTDAEIKKRIKQIEAQYIQREKQQGLGRPIISTIFKGYRIIAVGNRFYWNKQENWQTFNDFLSYYVKSLFGQEWADVELKKDEADRHPFMKWYKSLCEEQRKTFQKKGELFETPVTGAIFAFTTLAYNLYLIAHNIHLVLCEGLHKRLIERLKNIDSFYPAFYETIVVASFIKAGFQVQLEHEDDSSSDHAEFVAISPKTKRKYSVEAKHRQMGKNHTVIRNQLYKALEKILPHERVIFINLNTPDNLTIDGRLEWLDNVINQIHRSENEITIKGGPAPQAYVFVTNHPFLYNLDSYRFSPAAVAEGFKIPDFKIKSRFYSIREALASREKHIDMLDLMKALREYDQIPSTFDGEIPEYAFGEIKEPRLIIGNKYFIPDSSGTDVEATLEDVVVLENERKVYGLYRLDNGKQIMATCPLSEKEFEVFKKYPDTFFGMFKKHSNRANDPLELYDFFYGVYKNTSKDKLLEFLKGHPNIEAFQKMSQEELAKLYCEGLVYSAIK